MESNISKILPQILRDRLKTPTKNLSLTKLHGDASYRTYYRAKIEGGRTFIIMKLPEGISSPSEEITHSEKLTELPFLNIARFLKDQGIPVPEVYGYDESARLLILEDLGNETLEKRFAHCSLSEKEEWYRKAIHLLVLFQKKGMEKGAGCIAHQRSFDETLLNWEFEHFIEYGIQARQNKKIAENDLRAIRQGTHFITFALKQLPGTFTHRDYQSRNLMIHEGSLKILDFQDALIGPLPYDLVALLRDSYVSLPWKVVTQLIDEYLEVREKETGEKTDHAFFVKMFDWMTLQRKLKDTGRFVYIDRVKGNASFLQHIPNSLAYARAAFERQPELKNLFEVLKKYVPEFQD